MTSGGTVIASRSATIPSAVRVRVPATSANVGVGFDCLGLALELMAEFTFSPAASGALEITGCEERFMGPDNLVWRSYQAACEAFGATERPLHIHIDSPIPLAGGLGASSACVVAGIVAAQILGGMSYDRQRTLDLAVALEGHPDNVAPAVLGGLTSSFMDEGVVTTLRDDVAPSLRFVALTPPYEVRTEMARSILPAEVPRETAVWQMGRCVAVIRALRRGNCDLLARACVDRLHEPYRATLIPDYEALRQASLDAGAAAYIISGSGSTMLAICANEAVAASVAQAAQAAVPTVTARVLAPNATGTVLVA